MPACASQTGNCVDEGRSEPVVNTRGPASLGVWLERAHYADAYRCGPADERVEVGVIACAFQLDAGRCWDPSIRVHS